MPAHPNVATTFRSRSLTLSGPKPSRHPEGGRPLHKFTPAQGAFGKLSIELLKLVHITSSFGDLFFSQTGALGFTPSGDCCFDYEPASLDAHPMEIQDQVLFRAPAGSFSSNMAAVKCHPCRRRRGNSRIRSPVAAKIALASAGAIGGVPISPTPPGTPPVGTNRVWICGASRIRTTS